MCKNEIATQAICYHMRFYFRSMVLLIVVVFVVVVCLMCSVSCEGKKSHGIFLHRFLTEIHMITIGRSVLLCKSKPRKKELKEDDSHSRARLLQNEKKKKCAWLVKECDICRAQRWQSLFRNEKCLVAFCEYGTQRTQADIGFEFLTIVSHVQHHWHVDEC